MLSDLAKMAENELNLVEVASLQGQLVQAKHRAEALAHDLEVRNAFIRKTFGRYLSDEIVENLLASPEGLDLGGQTRRITVMMADLRGFSTLAEHMSAQQVVAMLNHFLGTMAEIIVRHQGTIDEFIGDAILVLFGAPMRHSDDARRAVACALEMQRAMPAVNAWNAERGLPRIELGVGINTGDVVIGNIGSAQRAKYGVVGSNVNLSARIESYTVGGQILISDATHTEAGSGVKVQQSFPIHPKGASEGVTVHHVVGLDGVTLPATAEPLTVLSRR